MFDGKTNVGKANTKKGDDKRIMNVSKCYDKTVWEREELPAGVSMQEEEAAQLFGGRHPFVAKPEDRDESIARAGCNDEVDRMSI